MREDRLVRLFPHKAPERRKPAIQQKLYVTRLPLRECPRGHYSTGRSTCRLFSTKSSHHMLHLHSTLTAHRQNQIEQSAAMRSGDDGRSI